ncbi:MAG TPA: pesticidal protein Cry7Aa [Gillisia sp.]|nr:pesticidal protein Cry7Aa [Gillisia sp.]
MIEIKKDNVILKKTDLSFENEAVLNPATICEGNMIHLFYRAVQKGNYSSIGYCKLKNPFKVTERLKKPILSPEFEYESHGMEDPRIVKIDDLYYLTYTAFDGKNALGALATSKDLKHFKKEGIIVPQIKYSKFKRLVSKCKITPKYFEMNEAYPLLMVKDVIFFPRRINDKLCFLQRIKPDIQIVSVNNLKELTKEFWDNYFLCFDENILLTSMHSHEISYLGGGCPPIETKYGWLLIYHGATSANDGSYVYSACASLLELDDPRKEIARLPYKLFIPDQEYELKGDVNKVVFPTGTILIKDTLFIYYGAADERIAFASPSLSALLAELLNYSRTDVKNIMTNY